MAQQRQPQAAGFNYDAGANRLQQVWPGFGLTDVAAQKAVTHKVDDLVKKHHPALGEKQSTAARQQLADCLYDKLPELSEAPKLWKNEAMFKIIDRAQQRLVRRKGPAEARRELPNSDSVASENDSSEEPQPLVNRRLTSPLGDGTDYNTWLRQGWQTSLTLHFLSTVHFYGVVDGLLADRVCAPVKAWYLADLDNSHSLSWSKLADRARACSEGAVGFHFNSSLYISGREGQKYPIKTQASLTSVLSDMDPPRDLIFTTAPVSRGPNVPIELNPVSTRDYASISEPNEP